MIQRKPALFIGSSSEDLEIARFVHQELDYDCEITIWDQGLSEVGKTLLESLLTKAEKFDFALLIATGNDKVEVRGEQHLAPRDNVMFELGLFMGRLGSNRTYLLINRDKPPKLPSDLAGVTLLTFGERIDQHYRSAIVPACQTIREQIKKLGLKEENRLEKLSKATEDIEDVSSKFSEMLNLLEIIVNKFEGLIDKDRFKEILGDVGDFSKLLGKKLLDRKKIEEK